MGNYVDSDRIGNFMPQMPVSGESGYVRTVALVDQAIEEAEAIIDSHLAQKYSLPFSIVPPLVRHLATQIATHMSYRQLYPADNFATNQYASQYEDWEKNAYAMLDLLKEGKMSLTLTGGSLVSTKTATRSVRGSHSDFTPTFDVDEPDQWQTDPDRLDDIASSRG